MNSEIERVRAHLGALPLFPLPAAVLLPYEFVPLHVFEPRYRALAKEVLSQEKPLALAQLAPGWEGSYEGRPAVEPVCGVGIVAQSRALPDGRYNLVLRGVARARIEEELPPERPFREVRATLLEDRYPPGGPEALEPLTEEVRRLLFAVCATMPGSGSTALAQVAALARSPGMLADVVGAALLTALEQRREALLTLEVEPRLELARAALAEVLARGGATPTPRFRN